MPASTLTSTSHLWSRSNCKPTLPWISRFSACILLLWGTANVLPSGKGETRFVSPDQVSECPVLEVMIFSLLKSLIKNIFTHLSPPLLLPSLPSFYSWPWIIVLWSKWVLLLWKRFLLKYSWFTMLGLFQVYSKVIQLYIYTYIYSFSYSFLWWFVTGDWTSLVAQTIKNPPCSVGDLGSISGLGRSPGGGMAAHSIIGEGNGNAFQYSCLEKPMDTRA